MKYFLMRMFLFWIFLSVSFGSYAGETIRIAAEEWPPFSSTHLKYNGLMSRIISESFALEGLKVEFGFFPGARALKYVQNGEWDGIGGWTATDERAKYYYFSDTLFSETMVFFHLKKHPFDWKEWSDLKGLRIGATVDYYYGKGFEKAESEGSILIERVYSDEINIKKILKKRIDISPMNLDAGLSLLNSRFKQTEIDSITYHPLPVDEGPLVLMFSRKVEKNKKIMRVFNDGLKKLKESGKYDLFFEESREGKYLNEQTRKKVDN